LSINKEPNKEQISFLFDKAIQEIEKINQDANTKKEEIVLRRAQDLEDKIQTDKICMEIVKRLYKKVSPTLVRECLDEKYKQGHRAENAKQKKNRKEIKLATPLLLNQKETQEVEREENIEDERQKNEIIVIGADGRSYIQREEGGELSKTETKDHPNPSTEDKNLTYLPSYNSQLEQEHNHKKPNKLTATSAAADNMRNTEEETYFVNLYEKDKDILYFEFPFGRRDLQYYMDSSYSNTEDNNKELWFNGKINIKTKKATCSFGKFDNCKENKNKNKIMKI